MFCFKIRHVLALLVAIVSLKANAQLTPIQILQNEISAIESQFGPNPQREKVRNLLEGKRVLLEKEIAAENVRRQEAARANDSDRVTEQRRAQAAEDARLAEERRREWDRRMAERQRFIDEENVRIRERAAAKAAADRVAAERAASEQARRAADAYAANDARSIAEKVAGSAAKDAESFQRGLGASRVQYDQALGTAKPGDWIRTSSGYIGTYLGYDGKAYFLRDVATGEVMRTGTRPEPVLGSYVVSRSGYRGRVTMIAPDGLFVLETDSSGRAATVRAERASPEITKFQDAQLRPGGQVEVPGRPGFFERVAKVFSDGRVLTEAGKLFKPVLNTAGRALGIVATPLQVLGHFDILHDQKAASDIGKGKCPSLSAADLAQGLAQLSQTQANTVLADCEKTKPALAAETRAAQEKLSQDLLTQLKKDSGSQSSCKASDGKDGDREVEVKGKDGLVSKLKFKKGELAEVDVRDPKQNTPAKINAAFTLDLTNNAGLMVKYLASKTSAAQQESYRDFTARLRCSSPTLGYNCRPTDFFPEGSEEYGLIGSSRHQPFGDWQQDFILKAHQEAMKLKEIARQYKKSSDPSTSFCNDLGPGGASPTQTATKSAGRG